MGLYTKILNVMKDVSYLQKDDKVDAGYNKSYKAITEEKVTSMVGESMRKHGLIILPLTINMTRDDMTFVGKNGERLERLTTVNNTYKIVDPESGESEVISSAGTGVDTQDKGIGKALTYAYKYLLLRTFAIPTGDDPDKIASDEDIKPVKKEVKKGYIPGEKLKELMTYAQQIHGEDAKACFQELCEMMGAKSARQLPDDEKMILDFIDGYDPTRLPFPMEDEHG